MQRYFVTGNIDDFSLSENDVFHLLKVMRARVGDEFEIVIDGQLFIAEVEMIKPLNIKIIKPVTEQRELACEVVLLYCLPKGDKLDYVVQKATELGVSEIVGVISSRTIVRLEKKEISKKLERYQKIIKEAAEQSKRLILPQFNEIIDFAAVARIKGDHYFIADENQALMPSQLFEQLSRIKSKERIVILVGSEGGFSLDEIEKAHEWGYQSISLGRRILRTETAAISILSIISFMLERL